MQWGTIDPIRATLRKNRKNYLSRYKWHLVAVSLATCADGLSTVLFMCHIGIEREIHPGIRHLAFWIGPVWGPVIGKGIQFAEVVFITMYSRKWAEPIFYLTTLLYSWAACHNLSDERLAYPIYMFLNKYLFFT